MEAEAYLIVGTSGSGKTEAAKILSKKWKKPVIWMDQNFEGFQDEKKLREVKSSTIVVDDIIQPSEKETLRIKRLLNVYKRHNENHVVCITHSVVRNNLMSLVSYFDRFLFTSHPNNEPSLDRLLKTLKYPLREDVLKDWNYYKSKAFYLALNADDRDHSVLSRKDLEPFNEENDEKKLKKMITVLENYMNGKEAKLILEFIASNVSISLISEDDFCVYLKTRKKPLVKISMLDYVNVLSDESKNPDSSIILLHKYLIKRCTFPSLFLKNKRLKGLTLKKKK